MESDIAIGSKIFQN